MATTVVFYDGVCGLCNRFVNFLLERDRSGRLRFAALQGPLARETLGPAGYDPTDLDTVYAIADWNTPRARVLARSRAALHAIGELGGAWAALAAAGRLVPRPLADAVYRSIARHRYRIFGRLDACPMPRPEWRERFLE